MTLLLIAGGLSAALALSSILLGYGARDEAPGKI
jgi:hypothetical protein